MWTVSHWTWPASSSLSPPLPLSALMSDSRRLPGCPRQWPRRHSGGCLFRVQEPFDQFYNNLFFCVSHRVVLNMFSLGYSFRRWRGWWNKCRQACQERRVHRTPWSHHTLQSSSPLRSKSTIKKSNMGQVWRHMKSVSCGSDCGRTWKTVRRDWGKLSKVLRRVSSKLNLPPKSCIPSRLKMMMNRKSSRSRDAIERTEFSRDATRLLREFQYLREDSQH